MPPKGPIVPSSFDNLMTFKDDIFRSLYCHLPASIVAYDAAKATATVQIAYKRVLPDSTLQAYPQLVNVPVFCYQGGGVGARFPVKAGDPCLILVADRNIDAWYLNGGNAPPPSPRAHSLADAFVMVGFNTQSAKITLALDADEGGIADAAAKVAVKSGKVKVANTTKNLNTILQTFLSAVASSSVLDAPTKAAATQAATDLALLLY